MRTAMSFGIVLGIAVLVAIWLAVESRAQAPDKGVLAGVWVRNRELGDAPPPRSERTDRGDRGDRGRGMGRGRRGFGGGRRDGSGGNDRAGRGNVEQTMRIRDAVRDIMYPPDQLTIVQTPSMIIITAPDGWTTRLAPDGTRVKDENTGIERKTRWDGARLVSEIAGAGQLLPGKAIQAFAVDGDNRLRITVQVEGGRNSQTRTITNVYDKKER